MAILLACLSTSGLTALGCSVAFTEYVVRSLKPTISDKGMLRAERLMVVVMSTIACLGALITPYMMMAFIWLFFMRIPFFLATIFAYWRRNTRALIWSTIACWVTDVLWLLFAPAITATLPSFLHPPFGYCYPSLIVTVVLYLLLSYVWKKDNKPPIFRGPAQPTATQASN
ncbi:MAG: hypothetical protein QFX33_00250 [Candidatus Nezhaarchaeota archaeon]|nr:hypothetical protein [Candidatus Nezhaarchaeota archaeon]